MSTQQQNQSVQALKIFFHLLSNDHKDLETHLIDAEKLLTLQECGILLSQKLKKPMNNVQFKFNIQGENLDKNKPLKNFIDKEQSEIIMIYEGIKPIIKQKQKQVHYDTILKYSFLQEKTHVKVYLELQGIGKIPDSNIHSRFLDRSIEIKIYDYKGKNWIFAVPKTQCQVNTKQSKIIKKDDKIIIKIGKIAQADNWFSLHKVKMVGQKQLD